MAASPVVSGGMAFDQATAEGSVFTFSEYTLDPQSRRLLHGHTVVPLTPKAFDTLEVLVRSSGRTVSKDDLLKQVWPGTFVQEDTLAQNISSIRRALGETADSPRHVLTVPRDGYRFVAPVQVIPRGDQAGAESPPEQHERPPQPSTKSRRLHSLRWLGTFVSGLAAGLGLAALAFIWLRQPARTTAPALPVAFEVFEPEGAHFSTSGGVLALSPDGRHLAFIAQGEDGQDHLWIRTSSSRESTQLPGTQDASQPFWAADSRSIAFFSQGALRRIDISGGEVRTVCHLASNAGALAGSWSSRGVILFSVMEKGFFAVPASGGDATHVQLAGIQDCGACVWPSFLPDGEHFLFTVASRRRDRGIYIGSIGGGPSRRILDDVSSTAYIPGGYLLYASAGALVARRLDPVGGQAAGDALPVADHIAFNPITSRAVFSASETGLIAYTEPLTTRLEWISRTGRVISTGPEGIFHEFAVSRTGRTLVSQLDPRLGTYDLWLYGPDWKTSTRLTFDPASDLSPVWSEDGTRAVFARSSGADGWQLYEVDVDRPGVERPLLPQPGPHDVSPILWKHDLLYYLASFNGEDVEVFTIRTDAPQQPTVVAERIAGTGQARLAPDGHWLAYQLHVADSRVPRAAVFVDSWPRGHGQSQVTSEGSAPRWGADGRELFFLAPDGYLMSAAVGDDGGIRPPVRVCQTQAVAASSVAGDPYDVAADGQRFLVKVPGHRRSIVMMSGWIPTGSR